MAAAGRTHTTQRAAAVALAMVGLGFELAPFSGSALASEAFAVGSAISWAASAIFVKRFMARAKVDLLALTAWQMLYGSLVLIALALLHGPAERIDPTPAFVLAMIYIVVPATALAWWLWMFALSQLSAGRAGIASLLTPVLGVLFAWLTLGERPGTAELAGLALTFWPWPSTRRRRRPPRPRGARLPVAERAFEELVQFCASDRPGRVGEQPLLRESALGQAPRRRRGRSRTRRCRWACGGLHQLDERRANASPASASAASRTSAPSRRAASRWRAGLAPR